MTLILLIDDDKDFSNFLREELLAHGYSVEYENSATRGLDRVMVEPQDLVLLDYRMPGMTGLEVLDKIRADEELTAIPVVLLSAKGQRSDVNAGLERGATEYMTKPFRPAALLECVNRLLSG